MEIAILILGLVIVGLASFVERVKLMWSAWRTYHKYRSALRYALFDSLKIKSVYTSKQAENIIKLNKYFGELLRHQKDKKLSFLSFFALWFRIYIYGYGKVYAERWQWIVEKVNREEDQRKLEELRKKNRQWF